MSSQPLSTSTNAAALPLSWVDRLFERMALTYGRKFSDQWGTVDATAMKKHWAEKLAGLTGPEIKRGVDALDTRDWPPSLPEFLKLCRPPIDPTVAYYEALYGSQARAKGDMGQWSHPAIYWAYTTIGQHDFANIGYSVLRPRWEMALNAQFARGEWSEIPLPRLALQAPGESLTGREEARKRLAEIGASGVIRPRTEEAGSKAWAQKIIDNQSAYPFISLKFAQEALGADA